MTGRRADPPTGVRRRISNGGSARIDAAAVVVSNVIGGGILLTPPHRRAPGAEPWALMSVWLAGGVLAFAGAMAYAELATMRPHAGGEYVYLREAYGPLARSSPAGRRSSPASPARSPPPRSGWPATSDASSRPPAMRRRVSSCRSAV